MKKFLTLAAAVAVIGTLTVADANAWSRKSTVTGAYGRTATTQATGSCYGGTCSRSVVRTGPNGGTATTSGQASCYNGVCTRSKTTTGAYGGTVTRQGSISRY